MNSGSWNAPSAERARTCADTASASMLGKLSVVGPSGVSCIIGCNGFSNTGNSGRYYNTGGSSSWSGGGGGGFRGGGGGFGK